MRFRKLELIPVLFILVAEIILCGLGAWQIQRMLWKNELVTRVEAAQQYAPLETIPEDTTGLEYRKVALTGGRFMPNLFFRGVGGKKNEAPGFFILAPYVLPDGRVVLVNRGFLPNNQRFGRQYRVLEGIIRPPRGKMFFLPENQPDKNIWLYEDLDAMSQQTKVRLLPFIIEVTGAYYPETYPIPSDGKINLRNDHLGYAITWFSLALIGLISFGLYYREKA